MTALLFAVVDNKLDIVKYLVEHGADTSHKSFDGTALSIAKNNAYMDIYKYLKNK